MRRFCFATLSCLLITGCFGARANSIVQEHSDSRLFRAQNVPLPNGHGAGPQFRHDVIPPYHDIRNPVPSSQARDSRADSRSRNTQGLARSKPRPISLHEAIHRALMRSAVVRTLNGGVNIEATTGFDPVIAETDWKAGWAAFDPRVSAKFEGSQVNKPPSSFFGPGLALQTRRDEGNFSVSLDKKWSPGTTTRVAYDPSLGYLFFPQGTFDPDEFNPSYSSDIVVELRQPLLRGAGRDVNLAPIQIAQTRIAQSMWEVQEVTLAEVRSVEDAYWNLQAAQLVQKSIEEVIPLAEEAVRVEELRFQSERNIFADVARAKTIFESFLQQRLRAIRAVRTRDYQLRQLIGMPVNDGALLVPSDPPRQTLAAFDHGALLATALEHRPDLIRSRLRVEAQEVRLATARNSLYPQLDVFAAYRTSGLASRLDRSLRQMREVEYTDWTLGATFSVPIGNRKALAELEGQELRLAKERALLTEFENQVSFQLAELRMEIELVWKRFQSAMRQSKSTEQWLKLSRIRYSSPPARNRNQDWLLLALYDYQQAMQSHIDAITSAGELLASYNTLLARLDEAQGILLEKRNVEFASDKIEFLKEQPRPVIPTSIPRAVTGNRRISTQQRDRPINSYGHTFSRIVTSHSAGTRANHFRTNGVARSRNVSRNPIVHRNNDSRAPIAGAGHSLVTIQSIEPVAPARSRFQSR